jgi:fused signal recognition particle receptor
VNEILRALGAHPAALLWLGLLAPLACIAVLEIRGRLRARTAEPPKGAVQPAPVAAPPPPAPAGLVEAAVEAPPEREPAPLPMPVPAPTLAPAPPAEPPPTPPRAGLRARLQRTRETLVGRLEALVGGRRLDPDLLEQVETLLFTADLGVATAQSLLEAVRKQGSGQDAAGLRELLRLALLDKLRRVEPGPDPALVGSGGPHVILVLGVNGSGKTTTIGKLAARYRAAGRSVILGAGDTFRAAAIEQLQVWGERVGCDVVTGKAGGDPAAVAFDTVAAARARGVDVAIVDTAGRLQTKRPLMEELTKITRVLARAADGAPHETLLVLDANTGQNAISQARLFTEAAGVSGIVLTKLDGTAKGGVIFGLADEFGIPVKHVGVGEAVEDLRDFSAEDLVSALFEAE